MTRDELPNAIGRALIAKNNVYDGEADVLMPVIDAYVAAERERLAQALEVALIADEYDSSIQVWNEALATASNIVRKGDA